MPENRYVREIKLFNPNRDLAVDDLHPNLSHKRPPVNPSEGLLDDEEEEMVNNAPPPARGRAAARSTSSGPAAAQPVRQPAEPAAAEPMPAAAAPAAPVNTNASSDSADARPLEGDIPDIIEGDFPEPIDL